MNASSSPTTSLHISNDILTNFSTHNGEFQNYIITFKPNTSLFNTSDSDIGNRSDNEFFEQAMETKVLLTIVYAIISIAGTVGNIITCAVIFSNKSMHTQTNYYLFSMAISDLLVIVTNIHMEIVLLWEQTTGFYTNELCKIRSLSAEMSTYASILTITAFTIERYMAICHPLQNHVFEDLGRIKFSIVAIWLISGLCASPQIIQYGTNETGFCTFLFLIPSLFEVSAVIFFIAPMTVITVLYVQIAIELKKSQRLARVASSIGSSSGMANNNYRSRNKGVIKMLG